MQQYSDDEAVQILAQMSEPPRSWIVRFWRRFVRALRRDATPRAYSPAAEQMRDWQARTRAFMVLLVLLTLSACTPFAAAPVQPVLDPPLTLSPAQRPLPTAEPTPVPASFLASLDTVTQLMLVELPPRDPRRLTERLNPDVDDVPLYAEAQLYQVGDRARFWVHNTDAKENVEIEAELIYQTDVAHVWVETDQPYDGRRIRQALDHFSTKTYPALIRGFGSESNPGIDGDPRLHVLHTAQIGAGVAGYFYSADKYTTAVNPFSNQKEIFFINLNWLNRLRDYTAYETVLAHEFQHMIHWNQDRGEDLWLNEGLSEYAQELAGYAPSANFAALFLGDPDLPLTIWGANPGANAPYYGSSYLFVAYLAQRFGDDFLRALVSEQRNGAAGVERALETVGAPAAFDELFADWVVANWTDAPDALEADGRYGYRRVDLPDARPAATYSRFPIEESAGDVANYGTDYLMLEGEGGGIFRFEGDAQTQLAPLQMPEDARLWWSNRGDDANPRLTRIFDLTAVQAGAPVTMTVDMWWNIEESYDYGYVLVSQNGEDWRILPGQRTRSDNSTGNALGPGYTGSSGDSAAPAWVQEQYDLSEFAGAPLWVQFSYVTDDAINTEGWFLDNVAIPAIGYADDFAGDVSGWQSEGWVLTNNRLPQRWLVQVMAFDGERLTGVTQVPVGADGRAEVAIGDLGGRRRAVVAISGLTPRTTERADYRYWLETREVTSSSP